MPRLHLKKDPTAVQSQSDFVSIMIGKKRYFIIIFIFITEIIIFIFITISLRKFLFGYCSSEFVLLSFGYSEQLLAYFYAYSSARYEIQELNT